MVFQLTNVRFDYFTVDQLSEDFAKYIKDPMPFYAREDEYLYLMEINEIDHIRFPASITHDDHQHYFHFHIGQEGKYKVYYYDGMDLNRSTPDDDYETHNEGDQPTMTISQDPQVLDTLKTHGYDINEIQRDGTPEEADRISRWLQLLSADIGSSVELSENF